jgi:hypothetical protein
MANPAGESSGGVLRLDFDRRLMLQFRGSVVPPTQDCHALVGMFHLRVEAFGRRSILVHSPEIMG